MFEWLKKRKVYKRLFAGKEGASLISVVIGVVFLTAIGVTILTVATRYVTTVIVAKYSSDNFYQTEGILEEVRTGLIEYANDSSEAAYKDVMENYTAETENMKDVFGVKYLSGLATKLLDGTTYSEDDVENQKGTYVPISIDVLKNLTKVPDAVKAVPGTNVAFIINCDSESNYTLTIKNLLVDFEDSANYRSSINSDIVFKIPDYKFEGDSTLEAAKNFVVINDDQLSVDSANISTQFIGNVYAGNDDSGIKIDGGDNNVSFNSKMIIARGSLDAYTGSNLTIQGENSTIGDLWVQNIRLMKKGIGSTLTTNVSLNENAYVSNDLDVQDSDSVIRLFGKYYGYSYNYSNTYSNTGDPLNKEDLSSNYSSAILVNGLNTTLDASGLDKLVLAGRAFISKPEEGLPPSTPNILTGESLSVKSNQLAYLVPESYITIDHNPMATSELTSELEDSIKTALLADPALSQYLDDSKPFIANYNNKGYVFLFLNFKTQAKANQYFKDYYQGTIEFKDEDDVVLDNQEQLREKAQTYLSVPDMGSSKFSGNLSLVAGNILYNYEASAGASIQQPNYFNGASPKDNLLEDGRKIAIDYLGLCKTLLRSGATDRSSDIRLNEDDEPLVSSRIIRFDRIDETKSKVYTTKDGDEIGQIKVVDGDYTLASTADNGLLIVNGDVTVTSNFQGLILSNGNVNVTGNHKLKYDYVTIDNVLEEVEKDKEYSKYFVGFDEYRIPTDDLNKCVNYQNWVKNNY